VLADESDIRGCGALITGDDVELDSITLGQCASPLDRALVDEAIPSAVFRGDEAESLGRVELLHSAGVTHGNCPR
jgi:hypothetical protein